MAADGEERGRKNLPFPRPSFVQVLSFSLSFFFLLFSFSISLGDYWENWE